MQLKAAIFMAALLAAPVCAGAQTMKSGLWHVSSRVEADGALGQQMAMAQQQLASLPPEQRRMMESMMSQRGISMGNSPGAVDSKVCVTKEMVARNEVPSGKSGCRQTVTQSSGNTMKIAYTCSNPPTRGEGRITFTSPEAYTMTMAVKSSANGQEQEMNMTTNGKWLSADCGDIKPGTGVR